MMLEENMLVADRSSDGSASVRTQRGFTLTELMVTVAVAGILAMVAVPNMRTFLQNNRLSSASNDLLRSFNLARTEAIKHQTNVAVCAVADPTLAAPQCSYGAFNGWIVFQDTNLNWKWEDRKSTRLNSSHSQISYAVFCLKKKKHNVIVTYRTVPIPPDSPPRLSAS